MNVQEFIEKFAEAIDAETSELTVETEFRTLDEWSSLISLSVIAMVDEEFDVALKGADFRSANTIEDLYKIVISKL